MGCSGVFTASVRTKTCVAVSSLGSMYVLACVWFRDCAGATCRIVSLRRSVYCVRSGVSVCVFLTMRSPGRRRLVPYIISAEL